MMNKEQMLAAFDAYDSNSYLMESDPDKRSKSYAWHTAIGLQAVDGLKISDYLAKTAVRSIEGEISFDQAGVLLNPIISRVTHTILLI